jgi:Zn-dependent protease
MSARPHFRLFGIPVRVEPFFWIVAVLFGLSYEKIPLILTWVLVVFVSVLVHELGHALALKAFARPSAIVLHGFGGVTISPRDVSSRGRSVIVSLAGSLTAIVVLGIPARALRDSDWAREDLVDWVLGGGEGFSLWWLLYMAAFVNIWWSIINLLPVRPLDGGNVATELFGLPAARRVSLVAAAGLALFAFANGEDYAGFFAIMLGAFNFMEIRGESGAGRGPVEAFHVDAPDPGDAPAGKRRSRARSHADLRAVPPLAPARQPGTDRATAESRAWTALREGRPEAALSALEPFARDDGLDPYLRASVALASGRGEMADQLFERAYTAQPDGPPNLVVAGLLADAGRAVAVAHRLVARGTAGTDAAGSLQTHLHYASRFPEAAEVGELIFAASPRSPAQTAFEIACSWSRAGKAAAAVHWVEAAIDAGFTSGRLLDGEPDLESARLEPSWPLVRARLAS